MKPYKKLPLTLHELVAYDPEQPSCLRIIGGCTIHQHNAGYWTLQVRGHKYLSHRVVWALHHGDPDPLTVDHKDNDRGNGRIENLRLATKAQQMYNQPITSRNTTGVKGLSWCNTRNLWVGQVRCAKKTHKLRHAERGVVEAWLTSKRAELHKEFAHG